MCTCVFCRLEIVSSPQPQLAEVTQSSPRRQMTVYTCCLALWTSPRVQLSGSPTSLPTERWFKSETKILHCTLMTRWFTAVLFFQKLLMWKDGQVRRIFWLQLYLCIDFFYVNVHSVFMSLAKCIYTVLYSHFVLFKIITIFAQIQGNTRILIYPF